MARPLGAALCAILSLGRRGACDSPEAGGLSLSAHAGPGGVDPLGGAGPAARPLRRGGGGGRRGAPRRRRRLRGRGRQSNGLGTDESALVRAGRAAARRAGGDHPFHVPRPQLDGLAVGPSRGAHAGHPHGDRALRRSAQPRPIRQRHGGVGRQGGRADRPESRPSTGVSIRPGTSSAQGRTSPSRRRRTPTTPTSTPRSRGCRTRRSAARTSSLPNRRTRRRLSSAFWSAPSPSDGRWYWA